MFENNNYKVLESLLMNVENSSWEVYDDCEELNYSESKKVEACGEKKFNGNDLCRYIEIINDRLRIKLYENESISEGVELFFNTLPSLKEGRYEGGFFTINAYAIKNGKESSKYVDHQCRTGEKAGFDGAYYFVGNLLNMLKTEKGYRPYFQLMATVLKTLSQTEKEVGITDSPLRDNYYNLYKQDTVECIDYLLNPELDDLQKWSGWYGLGATLVNLLNMDLKPNEKDELTDLLSHKELVPYFEQILRSGEFNNGLKGMSTILNNIISQLNINLNDPLAINNPNLKYYVEIFEKLRKIYHLNERKFLAVSPNNFENIKKKGKVIGFSGDSCVSILTDGNRVFPVTIDIHGIIRDYGKIYDISNNENSIIIDSLRDINKKFYNLSEKYLPSTIIKAILSYDAENDEIIGFDKHVEALYNEELNELKKISQSICHASSRNMFDEYKKLKASGIKLVEFMSTPTQNSSELRHEVIQEDEDLSDEKERLEQKINICKLAEAQRQFLPFMEKAKMRALSARASA